MREEMELIQKQDIHFKYTQVKNIHLECQQRNLGVCNLPFSRGIHSLYQECMMLIVQKNMQQR